MIVAPLTMVKYRRLSILAGTVSVVILGLVSLFFGAASIEPVNVFKLIIGEAEPLAQMIVLELRLPRVLLAAGVGALLASSGALTQGLFRNPLADPSLIGVSAGATAGASVVIVFLDAYQIPALGLSLVSLGAFSGGVLAVVVVYRIATGITGTSVATMLLAGIAISFLAGSISTVLEFVADNEMLRRISLWRMGGLEAADYPRVFIISVVCCIVLFVLPRYYTALDALLLGESEARHLGFNTSSIKLQIIVIVAASVGASVALAGTIAFIGLVVPHVLRIVVGPQHRYLLPLCACCGAILLIVADIFARTLIAPAEVPVGLMTVMLGVPIFISLLRQRHRYGMQ